MEENLDIAMRQFLNLKSKKILIYGTGMIAERLISMLQDFEIVGIIDRIYFEGEVKGLPILTWDDIDCNTADIIILASLKKNYPIIFERIQYYCLALEIEIYGENGQNLSKEYKLKYLSNIQENYYHKNEYELKNLINQYDVISFSLFDTLLMRKTLEKEDIFEILDNRIRNKGIKIPNLKKIRLTSEHQANTSDIYQIYDILKRVAGISEKEKRIILGEEIKCEQECLLPRKIMVELVKYAIDQGKTVNIIENTYFPEVIVEEFLKDAGIVGYAKLYLFFEKGLKKDNIILELYRKDVGNAKCLHIGDDLSIEKAIFRQYEIDVYEIKNACEMLKISSMRKLLIYSIGIENRMVLGLILAELFNNPFSLYNTSGIVKIDTIDLFGKIFIAPIVLVYLQMMVKTIKEKKREIILFTARDGYLFKKIYDDCFKEKINIPSIYFLTSRKLCLTSTLSNKQDILELSSYFLTESKLKKFLQEFLQEDVQIRKNGARINAEENFVFYQDKLIYNSAKMKENYLKYMRKIGIDKKKKYLFCELSSSGTIQHALNRILNIELEGFYLYRRNKMKRKELNITSIYKDENVNHIEQFRDLLELVLTAPVPSICAMKEDGSPVYSEEKRTKYELQLLEKVQKAIDQFIRQFVKLRGVGTTISCEYANEVLGFFDYVNLQGEAKDFMDQKNVDDMSQRLFNAWNH